MIKQISIIEELDLHLQNEEITNLIEENLFELTIPELLYVGNSTSIEEAKNLCRELKYKKNLKIDEIINNCHNKENLLELEKAIKFKQRNIFVLELIATSNTPYEIRKGFECGSRYTRENLYGTGFPAFNHLFAQNKEVALPLDVLILLPNNELTTYLEFKSTEKTKNKTKSLTF